MVSLAGSIQNSAVPLATGLHRAFISFILHLVSPCPKKSRGSAILSISRSPQPRFLPLNQRIMHSKRVTRDGRGLLDNDRHTRESTTTPSWRTFFSSSNIPGRLSAVLLGAPNGRGAELGTSFSRTRVALGWARKEGRDEV